MTSVRNHRPLLSGSKWLFFAGIVLLAACSPKVQPVSAPVRTIPAAAKKESEKAPEKPASARVSTISMLLPFTLDDLNSGAQYTPGTLSRANLSLDYYQGFKLALDSLAERGYNYKLQVFDTKDAPAVASNLAYTPAIRTSDLVVGPVFPDDLQAFANILAGTGKVIPTVSPLSPAAPATVKDQFLVTVATPLEYHAWSAAEYINEHYKPKKVFILKSGFSEDNKYITPFRKGIDSLSKHKTKIIAPTIVRGRLDELMPQLSATEENVFVVPSTNQQFLMVTLHSLDSLAKIYPVTLFGHPSWTKFSYLKPDILQRLKTHITTTDRVDYKSSQVNAFIRSYRKAYRSEPTHYALMGYDEGMYFGALLGENPEDLKKLDKKDFTGLLNKYRFIKKPGLGWINTHVNVLQYNNFELKKVE
ncbi:MAG TPA: ABC transporter substrate-binding protein [Mucilaginibacter sp.]|jgi:ABC-type branched-subunit amino acid transport system substrate-binding protein|nr:ABC transporter substrate-binding protein [Mucilaginibacter sp.]